MMVAYFKIILFENSKVNQSYNNRVSMNFSYNVCTYENIFMDT